MPEALVIFTVKTENIEAMSPQTNRSLKDCNPIDKLQEARKHDEAECRGSHGKYRKFAKIY